jgi:hypothetical protein
MTHFIKNGTRFDVAADQAIDIREALPVGTYTVKFDKDAGVYFLEIISDYKLPGKIYGRTPSQSQRILDTFQDRGKSTGVLLSGEKGSGKTLLSTLISVDGRSRDLPTIVINQAHFGDTFNTFIQKIEQMAIIIFDEFEKVYDAQQQEKLLTLLDGVYPSKKLFIMTCNNKWRIDSNMSNRPGRLFYRIDFKGLDDAFIREYCQDTLNDKSHIDSICRVAMMFGAFNFDILKALVEDMNRYNETPQQAMEILNAKPELSDSVAYTVDLQVGGKTIGTDALYHTQWSGNPLSQDIGISYDPDPKNDETDFTEAMFSSENLQHIDPAAGKFEFSKPNGDRVVLTKVKPKVYDYHNAF